MSWSTEHVAGPGRRTFFVSWIKDEPRGGVDSEKGVKKVPKNALFGLSI